MRVVDDSLKGRAVPSISSAFRVFAFHIFRDDDEHRMLIRIKNRILGPVTGEVINVDNFNFSAKRLLNAWEDYVSAKKTEPALLQLAKDCSAEFDWFKKRFFQGGIADTFYQFLDVNKTDGRIEFESERLFYPIELLYIKPVTDRVDVNAFLGLSVPISKRLNKGYMPFDDERIDAKCEIAFVSCGTLAGSKRERDFLAGNAPPKSGSKFSAFEKHFTSHVDVLDLWTGKYPEFDIIHFSAHVYKIAENERCPSYLEMRLAGGVCIAPFHFGSATGVTQKTKPFVFLNCCKTAEERLNSTSGFIDEMFPEFAKGFIATQADIEESIAAEIAISFYDLFFRGYSICQSLFVTQTFYASEHRDVSVLAYCIFNIAPDTVISKV